MTYIDRLNNFNRWLESNALPANSQLMYFKLLGVFNRAGWPRSVQVDTPRLMQLTCCCKDAAYRARDRLVESGFISFHRGGKGNPSNYFLSEKTTVYATTNAAPNATHIKNKNNNKTKNNLSPPKSYDIKELMARYVCLSTSEDQSISRL